MDATSYPRASPVNRFPERSTSFNPPGKVLVFLVLSGSGIVHIHYCLGKRSFPLSYVSELTRVCSLQHPCHHLFNGHWKGVLLEHQDTHQGHIHEHTSKVHPGAILAAQDFLEL